MSQLSPLSWEENGIWEEKISKRHACPLRINKKKFHCDILFFGLYKEIWICK